MRTSWSRRWFVIRGGNLAYYRYRRGSSGARVLPLASIYCVKKVSRQHVFGMFVLQLCADDCTLYVRTEESDGLNRWFHALTLQTRLWRRACSRLECTTHAKQNVGGGRACGMNTSSAGALAPAQDLSPAPRLVQSVDIRRNSIGEEAGELLDRIHQFEMQMEERSSTASARPAHGITTPVGQVKTPKATTTSCRVSAVTAGSPLSPLPPRRIAWAQPPLLPRPQSTGYTG